MGGKLLNGRRVTREEFFDIEDRVCAFLGAHRLHQFIDKTTFGDIDLVLPISTKERSMRLLESPVVNGDVISFLWDGFQVDLICVPDDMVEYSIDFFSHGDKSNLLGRLIKYHYNLTFSSKGLYKKYNINSGYYVRKEMLDKGSYKDIVEKFFRKPLIDFQTEEELFEWVKSSVLFEREAFYLENLTAEQRARDRKRPFYQRWLDYIEVPECPYDLTELDSYHVEEYLKLVEFNSQFKGISKITGLQGKELGKFIKHLKTKYKVGDKIDIEQEYKNAFST